MPGGRLNVGRAALVVLSGAAAALIGLLLQAFAPGDELAWFIVFALIALFGAVRGVLLVALCILGGQFAGFANDNWWLESRVIPHLNVIAQWVAEMAPQGLDLITPEDMAHAIPVELPIELLSPFGT